MKYTLYEQMSPGRAMTSSTPSLTTAAAVDYDTSTLRRKLHSLREENTGLISENHQIQTRAEDLEFELQRSAARVKALALELDRSAVHTAEVCTSYLFIQCPSNVLEQFFSRVLRSP